MQFANVQSFCLYRFININSLGYNAEVHNLLYYFILQNIFPQHFAKPSHGLFQQYKCLCISLHLSQGKIGNENESLIQIHYAQIKRNSQLDENKFVYHIRYTPQFFIFLTEYKTISDNSEQQKPDFLF
jgi:hypothetical protein